VADKAHSALKYLQIVQDLSETHAIPLNLQDAFSENAQHLQKALVYHLTRKSTVNPACNVSVCKCITLFQFVCIFQFARDFHLAQWLKDIQLEVEKSIKNSSDSKTDTSEIFKTAQQKRSFLSSLRKPQKNFKYVPKKILNSLTLNSVYQAVLSYCLSRDQGDCSAAKNATSKNHPKDILCHKNHL